MSRRPLDAKLAFLAGWLLGRRRRRAGVSVLFLLAGALACLTGCPAAVLGVPYSLARSLEAISRPQPQPAQLRALPPATLVLVAAQIPPDAPTNSHGLALFRFERRRTTGAGGDETPSSGSWQVDPPLLQRMEMRLPDDTPLLVQIPQTATFLNAQQFDEEDPESGEKRRITGYLPGQTLAVEGTWEGDDLLTARTLYAGTPDEYTRFMATQPGAMLLMGLTCSGLGVGLVALGGILKLLGR